MHRRRTWAGAGLGVAPSLVLTLTLGAAAPVRAQAPWVLEAIAPGVYATVAADTSRYALFANSLIVIGSEGVLVVDSRDTNEHADALIEQIRELTDLPVRTVVNSHWHWDHVNGNAAFRDAYAGVEIVAHPAATRLMAEEGPARMAEQIARLEARGERLRRFRSQGATDDGRPLTDDDRGQIARILSADQVRIGALEAVEPELPGREVEDSWQPTGLGREVHVLALPEAHTPGDLAVWIPDAAVLSLGDVIEHGLPFVGDGRVLGHARSLEALDTLGARVHVPGHGPVPTDEGLFRGQLDFWQRLDHALAGSAPDSAALAVMADELIAETSPEAFPGGWDADGRPTDGLRDFVVGALRQAAEEESSTAGVLNGPQLRPRAERRPVESGPRRAHPRQPSDRGS